MLDFDTALIGVGVLTSTPAGTVVTIFGKAGAPGCVGDRLMLTWLVLVSVVVLLLLSKAFARARKGTRW